MREEEIYAVGRHATLSLKPDDGIDACLYPAEPPRHGSPHRTGQRGRSGALGLTHNLTQSRLPDTAVLLMFVP
jgi:hypothetical protein